MKGRNLQEELVIAEKKKKKKVSVLTNHIFGKSFGELFRIGPGTWIKKVDGVNFDLTLTLNQFNDDSS